MSPTVLRRWQIGFVCTLAVSGCVLLLLADWRIQVGTMLVLWANNLGRDIEGKR